MVALRLVSNEELDQREQAARSQALDLTKQPDPLSDLCQFVRHQYYLFRRSREDRGIDAKMLEALRTFRGQYEPTQLNAIQKFGGSEVFSRITASRCRGASAILRDVFLSSRRAWRLAPTPDPKLPDDVNTVVNQLVASEVATLAQSGEPVPSPENVEMRRLELMETVLKGMRLKAKVQADAAQDKLDDELKEGGWYRALFELLQDLPLYPFAVLKGPEFRQQLSPVWQNGQITLRRKVVRHWRRVNPFDFFFSPGASCVADADVIERIKLDRAQLDALRGVPGYDEAAIDSVLDDYGRGGLVDWLNTTDTEQARLQRKEDPHQNRSHLIDTLLYTGMVQGRLLIERGFKQIKEPFQEYSVSVWVIGDHVIKAHLNPFKLRRHDYFVSSFEKVPGAIPGQALPELLHDIQAVANACLRALVNNLSIASGPQVLLDVLQHDPQQDDQLYPWKRWKIRRSPLATQGANTRPVDFYQPDSRAAELLTVYEKFQQIADDISAIPRYITGNEKIGGAGRTASGLAMLMGNTTRVVQQVASNVDEDILRPSLELLYDVLLLTDQTGLLRGDESIHVEGVMVAAQRETERMRQLEFLQLTNNPVDLQITGVNGRSEVLREVSEGLGLDSARVVPDASELATRDPVTMPETGGGDLPAPRSDRQALMGPQTQAARPGYG